MEKYTTAEKQINKEFMLDFCAKIFDDAGRKLAYSKSRTRRPLLHSDHDRLDAEISRIVDASSSVKSVHFTSEEINNAIKTRWLKFIKQARIKSKRPKKLSKYQKAHCMKELDDWLEKAHPTYVQSYKTLTSFGMRGLLHYYIQEIQPKKPEGKVLKELSKLYPSDGAVSEMIVKHWMEEVLVGIEESVVREEKTLTTPQHRYQQTTCIQALANCIQIFANWMEVIYPASVNGNILEESVVGEEGPLTTLQHTTVPKESLQSTEETSLIGMARTSQFVETPTRECTS